MFQRFRSLAVSTVLVGLVASFACSAPEDEDDDSFGTDADGDGSNGNGNSTTGNSTTGSNGNNNNGGSGGTGGTGGTDSSGGASSGSGSNVQSATSSGNSTTSSSTTGGPSIGGDLGEACEGLPYEGGGFEDEACVGTGYEAEAFPVDLVLMVDVSTSMVDNEVDGVTRWELLKNAVTEFVGDPDAADIGMGIDFWSWYDDDSCNVDQYAEPTVPIGSLGDIGDEIVQALEDQNPGGLTPTYPALKGAIQYAKQHAADNPARQAVVVFVTDGYPTQCDPQDIPSIAELAAESWNDSPRVPVFVIGIDGVYNLDQIASAGGTREPFLVEGEGSTERLVTALKNITTDTARCEFEIPPSPNPDFLSPDTEAVQVIYTPGSGDPQEIPRVTGYSACATAPNGGWYTGGLDADGKPTKIVVCPCSCANFGAGSVEVTLGCKATPSVE